MSARRTQKPPDRATRSRSRDRHARPGKPAADAAVGLDPHEHRAGRLARRAELEKQLAVLAQQHPDPRQQPRGSPADTDVAVQQQGATPPAAPRQLVEDRRHDRPGAASRRELDGGGRQVDAEREHAASRERVEMATRSAADVEHRPVQVAEQLLVGRVGRAEVAIEGQRQGRSVAQPQAGAGSGPPPARARRKPSAYSRSGWIMPPAPRACSRIGSAALGARRRGHPSIVSTSRSAGCAWTRSPSSRKRPRCRVQVFEQLIGTPANAEVRAA